MSSCRVGKRWIMGGGFGSGDSYQSVRNLRSLGLGWDFLDAVPLANLARYLSSNDGRYEGVVFVKSCIILVLSRMTGVL